MRYLRLIALREFIENVRTKGFWLGILLFPVLLIAATSVPLLLHRKSQPTRLYTVVDPSGHFAPLLHEALDPATNAPFPDPNAGRFQSIPVPPEVPLDDPVAAEAALRPYLRGNRAPPGFPQGTRLFAALILPPDLATQESPLWRYWSENPADPSLQHRAEEVLTRELQRLAFTRLGLDPEVIRKVTRTRARTTALDAAKPVGQETVDLSDQVRRWLPSVLVYILWVAIFAIAQMLLNSVIEEKSNRVIEVLLSSVTPGELMLGKLAGIGAVGLVLLGTWLATLGGYLWLQLPAADAISAQGSAPGAAASPVAALADGLVATLTGTWLVPGFLFYFLLGYTLYAALFLTIGSLCNTIKEAQTLFGPMILVLMVPLFLLPFIPRDPNGPLATALSWVPPYTPFIMINRLTASPPLRDVVGSGLLLIAFTGVVLWASGRIFRSAILRTGQPPRLRELWAWLCGR